MGEVMGQLEHGGAPRASTPRPRRRDRVLPIALLAALALPASAAASDSGQRVHRCVGRDGEIVFSGLRCSEEASAVTATTAATEAPRPRADACARSAGELRERVLAAIARHDSNAIAALMHWGGVGGGAAKQRLAELRALVAAPLLSLDEEAEAFSVRTGGAAGTDAQSMRFGIHVDGICHWLEW